MGVVLAWSLAHGGPAGNFFGTTLYDSVAYGPNLKPPRLKDVPDSEDYSGELHKSTNQAKVSYCYCRC